MIRKKYGRKELLFKGTIGIIGTHSGAGSTHLSILAANYIYDKTGKKTAIIELHNHDDFHYLQMSRLEKAEEPEEGKFTISGVDYYKRVSKDNLAEVLNEPYSVFILDLGHELDKCRDELIRCGLKIVVANLIQWKSNKLTHFLSEVENISGYKKWIYLSLNGEYDGILNKTRPVRVRNMPFEPDPFCLSKATTELFQKIIL